MVDRLRSLSIKARALLVVIGLILAAIWGFAVHMAAVLHNGLEQVVAAQLTSQVTFVADELDDEIKIRINVLKQIAATITPVILSDPVRVQRLLVQRDAPTTLFPIGVVAVDARGVVIADHPSDPPTRRGGFVGDTDYFREVMDYDRAAIGAPRIGRFAPRAIVPIAVPLHDAGGATAGLLLDPALVSDRDLFGKLEETKVGETGHFIMLSPRDNLIVAATEKERAMKPLPPRGVNPLLDRRLHEGFEGAGVTVNSLGVEVISASRKMDTTGWIVIAAIPTEEAFAPIKTFKRHIYVAALLASLSVGVILFLVLRRQLAPLENVGRAVQRMIDGREPFAPLPVERDDEIGRFVGNFNRLVAGRQKAEMEIRQFNVTLEQRVRERTTQLRALAVELTMAEERERHSIAQDLHDDLGQILAIAKLKLSSLEVAGSDGRHRDLTQQIREIEELIDRGNRSLRSLSLQLSPPVLQQLGLVPALEWLAEEMQRGHGLRVHVHDDGKPKPLPEPLRNTLFRAARELLINVAKHAGVDVAEVAVSTEEDCLMLAVSDAGVGFDTEKSEAPSVAGGFGLFSLRERVSYFDGEIHVDSAPGAGTTVVLTVPIAKRAGASAQ